MNGTEGSGSSGSDPDGEEIVPAGPALTCAVCRRRFKALKSGTENIYSICPDCRLGTVGPEAG